MAEAARLVDELTTLLYGVVKRWQLQNGRVCEIVQCGACRKKADKPSFVVHESDCPVRRLWQALELGDVVVRANAEEICDLEDKRDELEAKVNALTAQMESHDAQTARIAALEAENKALREALIRADAEGQRYVSTIPDLYECGICVGRGRRGSVGHRETCPFSALAAS